MALPKYADINGPVLTNGNRHYKEYGTADTQGNPGKYHIYYDGTVQFVPQYPEPAAPINPSTAMNPVPASPVAAPAPAPAPAPAAPTQPNGGVEAPAQPASATPPADSPVPSISAGGSSAQPTTGTTDSDGHTWLTNHDSGSRREGQQYYVERGHDSHNNSGEWHVYRDGARIFVGEDGNEISVADSGGATMTVTPGVSSTGSSQNLDGQRSASGFSGTQSSAAEPTQSTSVDVVSADTNTPIATPQPADPTGGLSPGGTYTVVEGDTMWDIAQRQNISLDQLKQLNPQIQDANLIHPGEQINLPAGGPVSFPTDSTYTASAPEAQIAANDTSRSAGWADGSAGVPNDPVNGVVSTPTVQTDPLKIDDDKHDR